MKPHTLHFVKFFKEYNINDEESSSTDSHEDIVADEMENLANCTEDTKTLEEQQIEDLIKQAIETKDNLSSKD